MGLINDIKKNQYDTIIIGFNDPTSQKEAHKKILELGYEPYMGNDPQEVNQKIEEDYYYPHIRYRKIKKEGD